MNKVKADKRSAPADNVTKPVRNDISVIIPTVGRSILKKCLQSIADGTELPGAVIVVDQSSNSEIQGWLEGLSDANVMAMYFPSRQTGRASGVNRGIESVSTRFLAITDDDCLVASDWLQNMRTQLNDNPRAVVTGRVESSGDEDVPFVVSSMSPATYTRPRLKFDSLSGGNMGVALNVMHHVGLLDEDSVLRCSEDGEWAYRALRAGVPIRYAPDVVVYHYGWRDGKQRRRQYREYARSCGGFYGKYFRQGDWFIFSRAIVHYLRELRRLFKAMLTRDIKHVQMSSACLIWLVPGIIAGIRSRCPVPHGKKCEI